MELKQLFVMASIPVLKVLLITALGLYLALDRVNILGEVTRKNLNTVVHAREYPHHICNWFHARMASHPINKASCPSARPCTGLLCCRKAWEAASNKLQSNSLIQIGAVYLWSYVYNIVRISSRRGTQDSNQSSERSSTSDQLVGFAIGVIPQIRKLLIGDGAPLRVIQDTAYLLGDGAIPALTLIIGGNLLQGLRGSGIQKSLVVGIIVVRYVALPLIGVLVVKGALKFGLVHSDPLYLFVLLLQFSLPPAMNIGIMTQLFGAGENECSVIMLWTYAFASLSLTFWSAAFMWLVARL
ncbi:hypothetical protein DVH24_010865 [Malus domestica]|uniref:Auxin efflux carrier family protein n=1 Tax=Malus domestica TaxID=3750 RepID=A0A498JSX8_MALDO|nr:hypothetical protein DVH24_010865 [Malus domestica]